MATRPPATLRLKDLKTQSEYVIEPKGVIVGREGGDADVRLPDSGVSKRHARIFSENGVWFVEDLNSSNGTYVDDEAVAGGAVALMTGSMLRLASRRLEVAVDEAARAEAESRRPPVGTGKPAKAAAGPTRADVKGGVAEPSARPTIEATFAAEQGDEEDDDEPDTQTPTPPPSAKKAGPAMSAARGSKPGGGGDAFDLPYLLKTMPVALAHYLKEAPVMALNPVGYIRRGIDEQKYEPMGRMDLIAYAVPAQLISAAIGFVAGVLVQIIAKVRFGAPISVGALIPIVPLIVGVVAGVVTGFIWHPLLTWLIRILKGQSDARSRSNYFMAVMTATVLLAIPTAVGTLLTVAHLPLINLVGPLLGLAASLVMVFLAYVWLTFFRVMAIVPKIVLALGALAVLGTAIGTLRTLVHDVQSLVSGSGSPPVIATGAPTSVAAVASAPTDEPTAPSGRPTSALRRGETLAPAVEASRPPAGQAARPTPAAATAPTASAAAATDTGPTSEAAAPPPLAQTSPASEEEDLPVHAEPPQVTAPVGGFSEWAHQRQAVEKAITADPTLLRKPAVLSLYKQMHQQLYAAKAKYTSKNPADAPVNERLRELEGYERSRNIVGELYRRINPR